MISLNNFPLTDAYQDPILSLSAIQVNLFVFNNPIKVIALKKPPGGGHDYEETVEQTITPGSVTFQNCVGLKFKNAVAGNIARVYVTIPEYDPKSPDPVAIGYTPTSVTVDSTGQVIPVGVTAVEQIQAITLSSSTPSIDFQAIPQTFRQLLVVGNLHGDAAAALVEIDCQLNGDGSGLYYWSEIEQGPTLAIGAANTDTKWRVGVTSGASIADTSIFSTLEFWLPNYNDSGKKVHFHSRCGAWDSVRMNQDINTGLYNFLGAPVTRIRFFPASGNFITGSTLALYGYH